MTSTNYEETRLLPLTTDLDIELRVADLIGRANLRQLWLLFLDEENMQLPLLVPIDGMPTSPREEQSAAVVGRIAGIMGEISATKVVFVWERYGPATLTPSDSAWLRSLHEECEATGIDLRATLLAHRAGVSWLTPGDYGHPSPGAQPGKPGSSG